MIYRPESQLQSRSQQELGKKKSGSARLNFGLARACMPHCIAVAKELLTGVNTDLDALNRFVEAHGAQTLTEGEESDYYVEGRGWKTAALADDLRQEGFEVVVQNLLYGEDADVAGMLSSHRVSNMQEIERYEILRQFGGADRGGWVEGMKVTLGEEGAIIPTISVPKLGGDGYGGHGIVVHKIADTHISYFDPDRNAVSRYTSQGIPVPGIEPEPGYSDLYYRQPIDTFIARMTGETMHIYQG